MIEPDFSRARVVVVGDVMLDRYVWGDVTRVSPEAPVPVLKCVRQTEVLGGAANVAANLAGLGAQVCLAGVCGLDGNGGVLKGLLQERGITDLTLGLQSLATITKTRVMAQNQQLLRIDEEESESIAAETEERIASALQGVIRPESVVVLSDYDKGVLTEGLCQKIISSSRSLGALVLVDPKGGDWEKYRGADCLTPNTKELAAFARIDSEREESLFSGAEEVLEGLEIRRMLLTRGSRGMVLFRKDKPPLPIEAKAREVFDVSGAGDTVIATLAGCLGAGSDWSEAAGIANRAAGIVVGKLGTRPVERAELEKELIPAAGINPKLVSLQEGLSKVSKWRKNRERVVFTNGCFDLLHAGHIKLLQTAAAQGDRLLVGLNSDRSVSGLKGADRPVVSQNDRAAVLAALESVDLVIIFEEETPLRLIESIKPDILVKGGDYAGKEVVGREVVEGSGGKVVLVALEDGVSTSGLLEQIMKSSS